MLGDEKEDEGMGAGQVGVEESKAAPIDQSNSGVDEIGGLSADAVRSEAVEAQEVGETVDEGISIHSKTSLSGDENENLKWYVLHTYSGYEEKAKQALVLRAKEKKLEGKIGEIYIPQTQKEMTTKTGKKKTISRTSFPGYVMAQLDLDDNVKVLVKDTPKITGFVGDNRNPKPLPDREVRAMLATVDTSEDAREQIIQPEVQFAKGDAVKVKDGPFSNFDGIIDEVRPEKARVRVLVSIFGRETPVELEFNQIEQL